MSTTSKIKSYWSNKFVLITGASSGLGSALVEALAPYHIHFCLLSRREERMKELATKLKSSGSSFWIRGCDVRDRQAVYSAINAFHRETGRIDVAWVNSGIGANTSFEKWDWDQVESVLDTNLKGAIYTIRACLEIMVPQGNGTIIGIGSATSMRGLPTRGIYGLTKIGLDYFMESLAAEFPQLQFTTIHPGFVDTEINRGQGYRIWLLPPEKAARLMIRAVASKKKLYIYPFRMKLLYHFIRRLPASMYRSLARQIILHHYDRKENPN
ncbi:MAG: SDR family NAD(P)-dependent oxidoreductase [candidate division KSB1 bacterium]|nr:SDR family NAD(P)-dependent oxidoreductase [candidate division KSB1 bacterium]MDZ7342456.1 SDR family NAD(P)-dependent oxidoreductase [candidate division KSB1 bacterium]